MTIAIFANSAGWNVMRAEVDAEVGAVDLRADARHARQQQQHDAGERDHVAVALEHAVVAQEDDRAPRTASSPTTNHCACSRASVVVDAVDHHQPEAREHRDEREQVRVGVGQREAHDEVRGQAEAEEHAAVGQRDVRQQVVRAG